MATATMSPSFKRGVSWETASRRTDEISDDLTEFRRLREEGYRQSLAMGLTDDVIEDFINEVIHDGREIK